MGKTLVHLPEGQDFFGGRAGKHTAMMKDFGFKKSVGASPAPMAKANGGMVHDDAAQDKAMVKPLIKKGIRQHETQEHGGKHADIQLRRGGALKGMKKAPKAMRKPQMQNPAVLPTASSPLTAARPPAPDFTASSAPPPGSGITAMRRGGRCG